MSLINTNTGTLLAMLSYSRPHDGKTELEFTNRFIDTLPGVTKDSFGNSWIDIEGDGDDVLWSCHVDTITNFDAIQKIKIINGIASLDLPYIAPVTMPYIAPVTMPSFAHPAYNVINRSIKIKPYQGRVLGADDSAGVFLMREMILAGKPGGYLFHRGEEHGGLGSAYVRDIEPLRLTPYCAAIALDRSKTNSIITHQFGERTASDSFAASLSKALSNAGLPGYKADRTGTFTDTAHYSEIISECSNISVGYDHAHSADETLDIGFVMKLRDTLLKLDLSKLAIERDHAVQDYVEDNYQGYPAYGSLVESILDYPDTVAKILREYGLDQDFLDAIRYKGQ